MITKKIIIDEVDDLKFVLSQENIEIPSFWSCIWPGIIIVSWNMVCATISATNDYISDNDAFWIVVFSGLVSLIVLLGTASGRTLFLSVPESFRRRSVIYCFFAKKIAIYACLYMVMTFLFAIYARTFYSTAFPFGFYLIFSTISFGIIMNLDFGRYQLSALVSLIESFREHSKNV